MFDWLVDVIAENAGKALFLLFVTGTVSLAAQLDSMIKDANANSPLYLRVLSIFLSKLARNVKRAANDQTAQLALACCALVFALGCAMIPDGPRVGGMAEASDVSGPSIELRADGSILCTTPDPLNHPCHANYAAAFEAWEPLLRALGIPFEAVLQMVGRSLLPAAAPVGD